jgi:aerobic-type carbon monoxide dehydrogenase small subunit (CoxS/CutS family)
MKRTIGLNLNGRDVTLHADDERALLWVLRTDFALTGTKYGCGEGYCGACTGGGQGGAHD